MARGYHVISCPCPLSPEKLDHLLIPEAGLAFVTSNSLHRVPLAGRAIHAQRFTDDGSAIKSRRVRIRFLQKTAATLLRQAELAIAEAHRRHDELEEHYIGAMDFAEVEPPGGGPAEKAGGGNVACAGSGAGRRPGGAAADTGFARVPAFGGRPAARLPCPLRKPKKQEPALNGRLLFYSVTYH